MPHRVAGRRRRSSPGVGFPFAVYNLEPPAGTPAMFGFNAFGVIVKLQAMVRPGDFGIVIDTASSPRRSEASREAT